ncbi:MAG: CapA family protein [Bacteroidales bacterium]
MAGKMDVSYRTDCLMAAFRRCLYAGTAALLFLLNSSILPAQSEKDDTSRLTLLFIGDIMGHDTQIAAAYDEKTGLYDYSGVFRYISPGIRNHDIAIANLEVTLAGPAYKGYPLFSSPAAIASAASEAGIGIMMTANNHSVDRGLDGILTTIYKLDILGIGHTGTYASAESRDTLVPLIIEEKGIRLALLNYTYGTNGIRVTPPSVVDLIDKELMVNDIERSKEAATDGIIVFLHWGTEYDTLPNRNQTELAEWLLRQGVTMVIGSHPHVIQPVMLEKSGEYQGDRLVVYSLGNFVSNQRNRRTDGGAMVSVTISKGNDGLIIEEAGYILTWVYTPYEYGRRRFYILPAAEFEDYPLLPADKDSRDRLKLFLEDSRRLMNNHSRGIREIR